MEGTLACSTFASVQLVLEERGLALAKVLHARVPSKHLCYAGGVSLNCVANGRLLAESPFEDIYVPPDPGDGGTSVGAALYVSALENGGAEPRQMQYGPYVGPAFDSREDVAMVPHVNTAHVHRYLKRGVERPAVATWRQEEFSDSATLAAETAKRLLAGQIVG